MELESKQIFDLLEKVGQRGTFGEAAMRELYKTFNRKIYAYAFHKISDPDLAGQIVIDTMHVVWKNPERFNGGSKFSTWLIGIARHKVLDALKNDQRSELDYDELDENVFCDGLGPFDTLAAKQRREGIWQCLNTLNAPHRESLRLAYCEGFSLKEIGAIQQCEEKTIKGRLYQARQRIKHPLQRFLAREESHGSETSKSVAACD